MYGLAELKTRDPRPKEDHVVHLEGVTWSDYERFLELRGGKSAPRMTYHKGTLELMSPSRDHEAVKSLIGRLLETYCLERGIRFLPLGSWTLRDHRERCGAEADECYLFGGSHAEAQRPHLAIEVVWTSGGLDKLEVYRTLGVAEVWYWRQGELTPHVLRDDRYEATERSERFPNLDLTLLASFLDRPTAYDAIHDYRKALRRSER